MVFFYLKSFLAFCYFFDYCEHEMPIELRNMISLKSYLYVRIKLQFFNITIKYFTKHQSLFKIWKKNFFIHNLWSVYRWAFHTKKKFPINLCLIQKFITSGNSSIFLRMHLTFSKCLKNVSISFKLC